MRCFHFKNYSFTCWMSHRVYQTVRKYFNNTTFKNSGVIKRSKSSWKNNFKPTLWAAKLINRSLCAFVHDLACYCYSPINAFEHEFEALQLFLRISLKQSAALRRSRCCGMKMVWVWSLAGCDWPSGLGALRWLKAARGQQVCMKPEQHNDKWTLYCHRCF